VSVWRQIRHAKHCRAPRANRPILHYSIAMHICIARKARGTHRARAPIVMNPLQRAVALAALAALTACAKTINYTDPLGPRYAGVSEIERVLAHRRIRCAESTPFEVVRQHPPGLVVCIYHQEERVFPLEDSRVRHDPRRVQGRCHAAPREG